MGTELGNLCSLLFIFVLHVSILTHAPPSPPLLTFGARHSHGCGRLYACSPPGGTQCPPFAVHVTVINTTTTTIYLVSDLEGSDNDDPICGISRIIYGR